MTSLRLLGLAALAALLVPNPSRSADFPLKEGDTWVMIGDSITAQKLHSNYFEAFCYARYPNLNFRFRNSGVGGDQITSAMKRFDWDAAPWKPTVISVELGMNDQGGVIVEKYLSNMKELTGMIRKTGARPIYLTASPINNGNTMAKLGGNQRLNDYADALKKFAGEEKAPFADQFHQLIDVWGKNKPGENLLTAVQTVEKLSKDSTLQGTELLKEFVEKNKAAVAKVATMQGDPVHPGPTGQLMMAAALLKDLGADPMVSAVTIVVGEKEAKTHKCKVTKLEFTGGQIKFERLDECLPFPIPDEARAGFAVSTLPLEMSDYRLTINGVSGDQFIHVNGVALGKATGAELAKGVNLTSFAKGPIADQGKAILAAVTAKESLVGQWRGLSKVATSAEATQVQKDQLAAIGKQIEEADAKIRTAATPKVLAFEVTPVK